MADETSPPSALWLEPRALLPLPEDALPWGYAEDAEGKGDLEFRSVESAAELDAAVRSKETILFAWTPGDAHLRPVHEIGAVADAVEARGRMQSERQLRGGRLPLLGTIALGAAAVLYWPEDRNQQFLALLAGLFVLLPLWRRGVERTWDAWMGLRLLRRDPAAWRAREAQRIRFSAWVSSGTSIAAFVLVGVFVALFLATLWAGPRPAFSELGLVKDRVRAGEWWRLFTCVLLHANFPHIFFNSSVALGLAGVARMLVDESRLLLAFVLSALAGSVASLILDPTTTSVGASGGILGWGGLLLGLALRFESLRHSGLVANMLRWVALLALIGFAGASFIDNAGHAGGFVAGLLMGLWLGRDSRRPLPIWTPVPPRTAWAAIFLAGGGVLAWMLWTLIRIALA